MNMEILQEHINTFTREVIDSGFKRDLDDYASSLPASQKNIVTLRDIAGKILPVLDGLYSGDLPASLRTLLPKTVHRPFTEVPYNDKLRALIDNTEIQLQEFFNQLTQFLNELKNQLQQNIDAISDIRGFIAPYISEDRKLITGDDLAIIAIIFNERQTITNLKQFTKTLSAWNRVLPIYHQLLKSESPRDIQIVDIHNGSIEFVVTLHMDVALDLVGLFRTGLEVFAAYLLYKKMITPILDTYHGNKQLIKLEEDREKLLLENIGLAIQKQIEEQHKQAKKADKAVDSTSLSKKVEQVTNLITSHIVVGNDMKLLAWPEAGENEEKGKKFVEQKDALRERSIAARRELRNITPDQQQMLLEAYGKIKEEKE